MWRDEVMVWLLMGGVKVHLSGAGVRRGSTEEAHPAEAFTDRQNGLTTCRPTATLPKTPVAEFSCESK